MTWVRGIKGKQEECQSGQVQSIGHKTCQSVGLGILEIGGTGTISYFLDTIMKPRHDLLVLVY